MHGRSYAQCLERKGSVKSSGESIANYPSGIEIQDSYQIDKASLDTDVGDIGNPYLI